MPSGCAAGSVPACSERLDYAPVSPGETARSSGDPDQPKEGDVHVLNEVDTLREDFIEGLVAANGNLVKRVPDTAAVMAAWAPTRGKVAIVSGGGSGHYPMLAGMVGRGGFTAVAIGEIFASPSSEQIYRATRAVDGGAGVLYLHWNYGGDVMHFRSAAKRVESDGHRRRERARHG